jgi:hypothetical protein
MGSAIDGPMLQRKPTYPPEGLVPSGLPILARGPPRPRPTYLSTAQAPTQGRDRARGS